MCSRRSAGTGPDDEFGRQPLGLGSPALQECHHSVHRCRAEPELGLARRGQGHPEMGPQQDITEAGDGYILRDSQAMA